MSEKLTLFSLLLFFTALIGGLAPIAFAKIRPQAWKGMVSLGAGVLLGMSFIHLLPKAAVYLPKFFGLWALLGFLLLFTVERFVMIHACDEHGCHYHTVGIAAFCGIALHSLLEGIALGSSLLLTDIAPLLLLGIVFHKAPAAMALTSILKLSHKSTKSIVFFVLGIALSAPLGLILSVSLFQGAFIPGWTGGILGLSAGSFIYLASCDLLPELHREMKGRGSRFIYFTVGIILSMVGVF